MIILKEYQSKAVNRLIDDSWILLKNPNRQQKMVLKAPTGSGKTLGYLMCMFPHVLKQPKPIEGIAGSKLSVPKPKGLIIVPTRELALQVATVARQSSKVSNTRLNAVLSMVE